MSSLDDGQLTELHSSLLETLRDRRFSKVLPLESKELRDRVPDNPTKTYVMDSEGRRVGVLIISNSVNPRLVATSVAKTREAKQALGEKAGSVVLEPVEDGGFSGLSFALWPLRRDLSSSRIVRYIERRRVRPKVLRWLETATRNTFCPDVGSELTQSLYTVPLKKMSENRRLSTGLRSAATRGLERLTAGRLAPVAVLQHSDLWLGNILLPLKGGARTRPDALGFTVIDWPGATLTGHPFFDLLRFGESSRISSRWMRSEIELHCRIVGCEPTEAVYYLAAALGIIGMNLEHFPESRYLEMCQRVFETASASV